MRAAGLATLSCIVNMARLCQARNRPVQDVASTLAQVALGSLTTSRSAAWRTPMVPPACNTVRPPT